MLQLIKDKNKLIKLKAYVTLQLALNKIPEIHFRLRSKKIKDYIYFFKKQKNKKYFIMVCANPKFPMSIFGIAYGQEYGKYKITSQEASTMAWHHPFSFIFFQKIKKIV